MNKRKIVVLIASLLATLLAVAPINRSYSVNVDAWMSNVKDDMKLILIYCHIQKKLSTLGEHCNSCSLTHF